MRLASNLESLLDQWAGPKSRVYSLYGLTDQSVKSVFQNVPNHVHDNSAFTTSIPTFLAPKQPKIQEKELREKEKIDMTKSWVSLSPLSQVKIPTRYRAGSGSSSTVRLSAISARLDDGSRSSSQVNLSVLRFTLGKNLSLSLSLFNSLSYLRRENGTVEMS